MTRIKRKICAFLAVFLVKYYNIIESLFLFLNRNIGLEKLGVWYHSGECVVYEEMNFITNDTQCQPLPFLLHVEEFGLYFDKHWLSLDLS